MNNKAIIIFVFFIPFFAIAQTGGKNVYDFLTIPTSPRAAALGGSAMAINDGDITLANDNPSLLSAKTDGQFSMEYTNYIADINMGYTSYAKNYKKLGMFSIGMQYLNGGDFTRADENGYTYDKFAVNEFALNLSYAKVLDSSFTLGATLKPIFSSYDVYNSIGIVMDVGASYTSKNKLITASVLAKNFGSQIKTYDGVYEKVPFDLQVGFSTKLAHAPFRFSIIAHNIQEPQLAYLNQNEVEPTNVENQGENSFEQEEKNETTLGQIMRHMIFGVEFIPTQNFFVRAGLNYQRRQELKFEEKPGAAGFSWGFGFKIKKLHFSYANVRYHTASNSNQIAITTNLSNFLN